MGKNGVKVQKRHGELKLKMSLFAYLTFTISALPPGGIFPLWLHFSHLSALGQKSIIQIFDTSDKNIRQNVENSVLGLHVYQVPLRIEREEKRNVKWRLFSHPRNFDVVHNITIKLYVYMLQICKHIFLSSKILRTHMESHDTEPKYECAECGKKFKSRAMWQHHGRLHSKVLITVSQRDT